MNLSQMHEHLRTELLRRIQRGDLTVTLLAHQTGFGRSHISQFLHGAARLSLSGLDRILEAQKLAAEDLVHLEAHPQASIRHLQLVPVVAHTTALFEPAFRVSQIESLLPLTSAALRSLRAKRSASRQSWQRFVAVRIDHYDARPMEPLVYGGAIAVIDRHYNSLVAYDPPRPNLYAVRDGQRVALRYIDATRTHLLVRPLSIGAPANLIEIAPEASPGEYISGRVAFILNHL
jgi:hypothetical protein